MAAKENHDVLILGLVGGAGFLAYQAFKHMIPGASGAASPLAPYVASPGSMVSQPSANVNPVASSIVDARITPGGDVGMAMFRKNWTQQQATERLATLRSAYQTALGRSAADLAAGDVVGANNWKGAALTHDADYFALTGLHLG